MAGNQQTMQRRAPVRVDWLDRWVGDLMFPRWLAEPAPAVDTRMPRIEELVEDKQLVVRVELPGIDPDRDVQLTVTDHTLHLRAERREEERKEENGEYRSEFFYGVLERNIPLPPGATESDIQASYKDGILEIRVPLDVQQPEPKKIEVQRN
jgi:HSP20 family protein